MSQPIKAAVSRMTRLLLVFAMVLSLVGGLLFSAQAKSVYNIKADSNVITTVEGISADTDSPVVDQILEQAGIEVGSSDVVEVTVTSVEESTDDEADASQQAETSEGAPSSSSDASAPDNADTDASSSSSFGAGVASEQVVQAITGDVSTAEDESGDAEQDSKEQDKEIWKREKWGPALPLLEDIYNFEDALLVGSILITFLRNADRVKVACLAQLVNVIAPILTRNGGGAWAQTIYWPFMHASKYGRGTALRALVNSPVYDCADYDAVPLIDATATMADDGGVTVFCVNRDPSEDFCLDIDLRAFGGMKLKEHILLHHDDVKAVNTEECPMNVAPTAGPGGAVDGGKAQVKLPALSWNVIRFEKA